MQLRFRVRCSWGLGLDALLYISSRPNKFYVSDFIAQNLAECCLLLFVEVECGTQQHHRAWCFNNQAMNLLSCTQVFAISLEMNVPECSCVIILRPNHIADVIVKC